MTGSQGTPQGYDLRYAIDLLSRYAGKHPTVDAALSELRRGGNPLVTLAAGLCILAAREIHAPRSCAPDR